MSGYAIGDRLPRAAAAIEHGIDRGLHPGAQIYVSLAGEPAVDDAVGLADVSQATDAEVHDRPLGTRDLVLWLSACKPVTAVAIAQLWEQGALDIDRTVASVIPEFGQNGKESITFRHVLTHTGGFRHADLADITMPWDECIRRVCEASLEPDWTPGKRAGYHDRPSWYILAEAVQRMDGRAFPAYVREAIFEPLGMHDSWIGIPDAEYDAYGDRIAPTYNTLRGATERQSWHARDNVTACWPAGNGRGPIRELGYFYEAMLNGGTRLGNEVLQPETVNELTRRHREGLLDETFQHRMDWGLGFMIDSGRYDQATLPYSFGVHSSDDAFGHGGRQSTAGFADPAHGLVVAVAFNGMPGEQKHNTRIREFCTALYEDLRFV